MIKYETVVKIKMKKHVRSIKNIYYSSSSPIFFFRKKGNKDLIVLLFEKKKKRQSTFEFGLGFF